MGPSKEEVIIIGSRILPGGVVGGDMTLPADLGDKKIALVAQSKKGKTYGLGVILEGLCRAKRPFIATDPASNLWGLRVRPDGTPSGLPVVVIGGAHGDIPLNRDAGERVAEALLASPQCAVIDFSMESQGDKRRFMTAFANRLMQTRSAFPLPIFLEEAPDLIPQKALGPQIAICKAAVSKLATIGGNFDYGVIAATQRPATLDKDVLSQCEALIVMGITHKKDRDTIRDWVEAKDIGDRVETMFDELGSLPPGHAWLWWPGEDRFERFVFGKRETLHPRDMKKLGLKQSEVKLGDVHVFVERMNREMTRTQGASAEAPPSINTRGGSPVIQIAPAVSHLEAELVKVCAERDNFREGMLEARASRFDVEQRLEAVRKRLKPEYDALRKLFEELGDGPASAAGADRSIYESWLQKAGKRGCRRMLEVLLDRPEITRNQLGTLSGVPATKSTFRAYMSWLKTNGLIEVDGEMVRLRAV